MFTKALRLFWSAAILVWLSVAIIAAPPLTITSSGYYLTIVDSSGVPTLVEIETVVDLRDGSEPDPPKPGPKKPQPPPAFDIAIVKAAKTAAEAINDANGSQAIKAVYDHVAGAFADGMLDDANIWPALKTATDDALTITSGATNWSPFRSSMGALITEMKQRGLMQSKAEIEKVLLSIAQGASMAADGKPALTDGQLVEIAIKTNEAISAQ